MGVCSVPKERAKTIKAAFAPVAWAGGMAAALIGVVASVRAVDTTINDFKIPGTQPSEATVAAGFTRLAQANSCRSCHGQYNESHEPYALWAASMMGQSGRDPVFFAALAIANQDAPFAGEMCLRCHVPQGWIAGRSSPPDGSALQSNDFQGVGCSVCHRAVDPVYTPGQSPAVDQAILANLSMPVVNPHNASLVYDPSDRRRGPVVVPPEAEYHDWLESPYHLSPRLCASCHDVSQPIWDRQPSGDYTLNAMDAPHPTQNKYDMYPEQRTYTEWANSSFANGPIDLGDRYAFGSPTSPVSTCQDCHMPPTTGTGCAPDLNGPVRDKLPRHFFNGGNTWVLRAVRQLYSDPTTGLNENTTNASIARAHAMLAAASDTEVTMAGGDIQVRITNQTGHKLPTGYPEGRRMWINVKFKDANGAVIAERGAYDLNTAELTTGDTKVYQMKAGLDAYAAKIYSDNRIPPRGFNNAAFTAQQAGHVGYSYADGQYWDDTLYAVPPGAATAEVRVYYQTTSKEYIEFLRDTNTTNTAGQTAYDMWALLGKSEPALMDEVVFSIPTGPVCNDLDFNNDGNIEPLDVDAYFSILGEGPCLGDIGGGCDSLDFNNDGNIEPEDVDAYFSVLGEGPCINN